MLSPWSLVPGILLPIKLYCFSVSAMKLSITLIEIYSFSAPSIDFKTLADFHIKLASLLSFLIFQMEIRLEVDRCLHVLTQRSDTHEHFRPMLRNQQDVSMGHRTTPSPQVTPQLLNFPAHEAGQPHSSEIYEGENGRKENGKRKSEAAVSPCRHLPLLGRSLRLTSVISKGLEKYYPAICYCLAIANKHVSETLRFLEMIPLKSPIHNVTPPVFTSIGEAK